MDDSTKGKLKRVIGRITEDRQVEGEGIAEEQAGREPTPDEVEAGVDAARRERESVAGVPKQPT